MIIINEIKKGLKVKKESYNANREPFIWVFGEWFGKRCGDNSFFLANYVASYYEKIKVYWITHDGTDTKGLSEKIEVVYMESSKAQDILYKAGVVVMNQGYLDISNVNANCVNGAITINLWHGVPWKYISHDCSKYRENILFKLYCKVVDSYRGTDLYIASSDEYFNICKSAFGANSGQIIKTGLPRNNIFYHEEEIRKSKEEILNYIKKITGKTYSKNTRIITYMPTFRDKNCEIFSFEKIKNNEFFQWLQKENILIIQKAHFVTEQRKEDSERARECEDNNRIVGISSGISQYILAATDLLITDYSSCFFDYLLLDRPIIHFLYDYEYYLKDDRGLYYDKEDVVCGDVAFKENELINIIKENIAYPQKNAKLRQKRREKYVTYENENSCNYIISSILSKLENKNDIIR